MRISFSNRVLMFLLLLFDSSPVIFVKAMHLSCERRTGAKPNKLNNERHFSVPLSCFFSVVVKA